MEIQWNPTVKQAQAWDALHDNVTTEILFGGGAGGGKSFLGCTWLILSSLAYPGTRWLMGRAILKTLKESTLLTFFKACKDFGLKNGVNYKYNSIEGVIKFTNGSEVYLKDLFSYPSDPEFDELGSTEYTGAFIDEASQVSEKAYQIVMSRLRYKLVEYNLIPKLLTATNPCKNFLYEDFYKASIENRLPIFRAFIQALVMDNPFMPKHYIDNLNKLDKLSKQRLLFGNWEYDEDATRLFNYDKLIDLFTNTPPVSGRDKKYITADIARFGNDYTVICLWHGVQINKIYASQKKSTKETADLIKSICEVEGIPHSQVVIDEDGVGGGVVDQIVNCKGFMNGSKPIDTPSKKLNFANLKSQCYFLLADYVNQSKIGIYNDINPEWKNWIISDLEQVRWNNPDKDGRVSITPKEEIKELLRGRSPDFGDAIMMRMLFELKGEYTPYFGFIEQRR